jgi:hypothetical protein
MNRLAARPRHPAYRESGKAGADVGEYCVDCDGYFMRAGNCRNGNEGEYRTEFDEILAFFTCR